MMVCEEELWGSALGLAVTIFLSHCPKPQPQGSQSWVRVSPWDRDKAIGGTQAIHFSLAPDPAPGLERIHFTCALPTPLLRVQIQGATSTTTYFIVGEAEPCHPNPAKLGNTKAKRFCLFFLQVYSAEMRCFPISCELNSNELNQTILVFQTV